MKLSWVSAVGLLLSGAMGAWALDAPHALHHARSADSHLAETHHAAAHHTAAHAAVKAAPDSQHVRLTPRGQARASARRVALTSRRHHSYERFTASSFAKGDITVGDVTAGEDPVVRQAAIDAMGDMNGTAVVIDPSNGRILAMVNQKLALSPGAEPCSTIKITVAMAALSEGLVTRSTPVQLGGFHMNMTDALAKSNNLYFEELGRELGFERVRYYANQFGLGELAGYNIEGEQLGVYPDKELPAAEGGVARMCSFGQGVSLTYSTPPPPRRPRPLNPRSSGPWTLPSMSPICRMAWLALWSTEPPAACAPTSTNCRSSARPEPARTREPASAGSPPTPTRSRAAW